jgi:hypothetical protein
MIYPAIAEDTALHARRKIAGIAKKFADQKILFR